MKRRTTSEEQTVIDAACAVVADAYDTADGYVIQPDLMRDLRDAVAKLREESNKEAEA